MNVAVAERPLARRAKPPTLSVKDARKVAEQCIDLHRKGDIPSLRTMPKLVETLAVLALDVRCLLATGAQSKARYDELRQEYYELEDEHSTLQDQYDSMAEALTESGYNLDDTDLPDSLGG